MRKGGSDVRVRVTVRVRVAAIALLWCWASGGTTARTAIARLKEWRSYLVRVLCVLWRFRVVGGIACETKKALVNAGGAASRSESL